MYSYYEKQSDNSSEKLESMYLITQIYHFRVYYPRDTLFYLSKDTCPTMFIVALFIIARTGK